MARRRRNRTRKFFFTAATFLLFFLALEVLLRTLGGSFIGPAASPISFQQIPRPFMTAEPDFRQMRLSIYADGRTTIKSPKPKEVFRVFSFGGSATLGMGFPYNGSFSRWLERILAQALPGPKAEVVNLGSVGFASEQEKMLVREVLEKGEPDLLVVYSGHNEFLDIKARRAMKQAGALSALDVAGRLEQSVATARLLGRFLPSGRRMAEKERRILSSYLDVQPEPEEIRDGYARFEANLREMARAAGARGVPVIFCTVLANPFYRFPELVMFGSRIETHPEGRNVYQAVGWLRLGRWDKAREALAPLPFAGARAELLRVYEAGGVRGMEHLDEKTRREMTEAARAFLAETSGLPIKGDEELYPLAISYRLLGEKEKLAETLEEARRSIEADRSPGNVALRKTLYAQFQDDETFHRAFEDLRLSDRYFNWAAPRANEIIRAAAAGEGAILADIEQSLPDWRDPAPSRYLLDYCHLNIEGNFEVARVLYETALSKGVLPPEASARSGADFRASLLAPDLEWLRTKAHDFTERDKYMGLDFRVCFVYGVPDPDSMAYLKWAEEDGAREPDKDLVRIFSEMRRFHAR